MAARAPAVRSTCRSRWVGATVANIGASALSVGVCQQRPNIVAAGIVIAVLGVLLLSPTVIALVGSSALRLAVAPRFAGRDIARHQSRSSAATAESTTPSSQRCPTSPFDGRGAVSTSLTSRSTAVSVERFWTARSFRSRRLPRWSGSASAP